MVAVAFVGAGCTSVGNAGLIMRSSADPMKVVKSSYRELGPVEASGCRFLIVGVVPAGNADPGHVLDKALKQMNADALLNVTTSNSLYGFVPIYNVFSITCTSIRGTAISFDQPATP
jgi:hypothetical protein